MQTHRWSLPISSSESPHLTSHSLTWTKFLVLKRKRAVRVALDSSCTLAIHFFCLIACTVSNTQKLDKNLLVPLFLLVYIFHGHEVCACFVSLELRCCSYTLRLTFKSMVLGNKGVPEFHDLNATLQAEPRATKAIHQPLINRGKQSFQGPISVHWTEQIL